MTVVESGDFAPAAWAAFLAEHVGVIARDEQAGAESSVVLPASPDGRDLAPRLAAALQCELFAGAIAVTSTVVQLARHGGLTIVDAHPAGVFVATLQPGVRGVDIDAAMAAPIMVDVVYRTRGEHADAAVVEVLAPDAATMDLAESARILGGGAGLRTADAFAELGALATRLDASMGATRVITDRGWVEHERQIGTTGVVVDPKLYLAFGISGAVQHTSGLGRPLHIISVNTDPHCPMMQLADLAVVSDANAVLTALLERTGHA